MTVKPQRPTHLSEKTLGTKNQIQAYKKNPPVVAHIDNIKIKLPLPNYEDLLEITKLSNLIAFEQKTLEQKQLMLQNTKEQYRKKLLSEEKDIRSRVITIKKRQNIKQLVAQIRQSELELQNKIMIRMAQYKPVQKLDKNQKHNLFLALINKVTDVS